MTVCSDHIMCTFQSDSTLCSCLNVKEILARNRQYIWVPMQLLKVLPLVYLFMTSWHTQLHLYSCLHYYFNHHISFYLLQTIVHLIHFLKTIVHLIHFLCHSIVLRIQIYHIWLDLYRTVIQSYCHFFTSISSLEINNLGMSLNKVWFYMYNYLSFVVGPMDSWVLFNSLSSYLMFIKVKRYNVVSE